MTLEFPGMTLLATLGLIVVCFVVVFVCCCFFSSFFVCVCIRLFQVPVGYLFASVFFIFSMFFFYSSTFELYPFIIIIW